MRSPAPHKLVRVDYDPVADLSFYISIGFVRWTEHIHQIEGAGFGTKHDRRWGAVLAWLVLICSWYTGGIPAGGLLLVAMLVC